MYPVITISREFGSGGHSIGEKVAAKLGIPFYDGEIVTRVAEESGYAKELIEEQGEYSTSANKWFDISAASAMYFQSPQDEIFIAQKRVIDQQWGNYHNYDVALDSGELGEETCVHIICELYNKK